MANTNPKRGTNRTFYMLDNIRSELEAHVEAHGMTASAIVGEALLEWMDGHPIPPARRRAIEQRRAAKAVLKRKVEEMGTSHYRRKIPPQVRLNLAA